MFVSSEIAGEIDIGEDQADSKSHVKVELQSKIMKFPVFSLERSEDGNFSVCFIDQGAMERFTGILLSGDSIRIYILDEQFNSQVVKLESDRCYLRVVR